jgi:flagellin-specific chaperone FliS
VFSNIVSLISLAVSAVAVTYTARVSRQVSEHEVTAEIISEYYSCVRALTEVQLREWRLAHIFEVAENYTAVSTKLKEVAPSPANREARIALELNERAIALTIFGIYEYVVYQLEAAKHAKAKNRTKFLLEAAEYFSGRLLPNPRLQYLWSNSGGNLECEFERLLREHYEQNVKVSPKAWDAIGPYG